MNENRRSTSADSHLDADSSPSRLMDQGMKEEPLGDEERPMELLDHDYCLLKPKLEEIDDSIEPKLEKPKKIYSEQPEVKLEPVESLEVAKQELLDPKLEELADFHTEQPDSKFEPLELKLEEPDFSELNCSYECSDYMNKDWPKLEEPEIGSPSSSTYPTIIRKQRKPLNQMCVVCNSLEPRDNIVHLHSKNRQLVFLIGLACAGKTMEEVRRLSDRRVLNICKVHLSEAVDEIYKTLNIKNIHEIDSCSKENKQKMMNVVNMLCGKINFNHFVPILSDFLKRTDRSIEVNGYMSSFSPAILKESKWISTYQPKRHTCSVCLLVKDERDITSILSRGRLLALMVGCVLGGKKTVEEAQLVLSKTRFFTCGRHLSEAAREIFKAVNIKNVDEMQSCSMENKEKLMNIVKSLSPSVCFLEFCSISKKNCLISKH